MYVIYGVLIFNKYIHRKVTQKHKEVNFFIFLHFYLGVMSSLIPNIMFYGIWWYEMLNTVLMQKGHINMTWRHFIYKWVNQNMLKQSSKSPISPHLKMHHLSRDHKCLEYRCQNMTKDLQLNLHFLFLGGLRPSLELLYKTNAYIFPYMIKQLNLLKFPIGHL